MIFPTLSLGQPTYALLGYAPDARHGLADDADDVYSLAEQGALSAEPVVPKPMRYRDIPAVYDTMEQSVAHDPLEHYMNDTPDGHKNTRRWRAGRVLTFCLPVAANIYHRRMWTINHGESIVALVDPTAKPAPGAALVDRLVVNTVRAIQALTQSREQRVRGTEFSTKFGAAVQNVLGEELARTIELGSLATRPDRQGRGYASTLVRMVTARADAQRMRTFLGSSNTANRAFYASLGFRIVHTIAIGAENPSWAEEPVLVDIMLREVGGRIGEAWDEKAADDGKEGVLVLLD